MVLQIHERLLPVECVRYRSTRSESGSVVCVRISKIMRKRIPSPAGLTLQPITIWIGMLPKWFCRWSQCHYLYKSKYPSKTSHISGACLTQSSSGAFCSFAPNLCLVNPWLNQALPTRISKYKDYLSDGKLFRRTNTVFYKSASIIAHQTNTRFSMKI